MKRRFTVYVGIIKVTAVLVVVVLSTSSKFYREEITDNFKRKGMDTGVEGGDDIRIGDEYRRI